MLIQIQRKYFGVNKDPFKRIPKKELVYTGHCRTLSKLSSDILIGLTDRGKTWVKKRLQIDCSCQKNRIWKMFVCEIMFWWCFTFAAVYICFTFCVSEDICYLLY